MTTTIRVTVLMLLAAVLVVGIYGCGGDDDTKQGEDVQASGDTGGQGGHDAGKTDTGVPHDAGHSDAGFMDTGNPVDAGHLDTGIPGDVGYTDVSHPDGGNDGGGFDGGYDAGYDGGSKDAGIDAGADAEHDVGQDTGGGDTGTSDTGQEDAGDAGCVSDCAGKCGGGDGCGGTCPDPCNGHGTCNAGYCTCGTGYALPSCNSCTAGYSGYPNCVPSTCGDYGAACCASNVCNGAIVCNNGTCVADSCTGKDDFTLCLLVTIPDRSYDICVGGACVSPGCGDETCNTGGPHFLPPDTDQRTCYDTTTAMTCPAFPCLSDGTPDFCGQDTQYGWDITHAQTARYTKTEPVAGEPLVADNITGLEWQGCPAGLSGSSCATGSAQGKTWVGALAYCDGLSWAGQIDWRLPDMYELHSIEDYGPSNPAIDTTAFPATPSDYFWSSSSYAGDATSAWFVDFEYGSLDSSEKTPYAFSVRCVRGVPNPQPARFSKTEPVAGQPVVADNTTGFTWQGCTAGLSDSACGSGSATMFTWQDALNYCEGLSWGNQADWRLPNVNELSSIVDRRRVNPSIDTTAFMATPSDYFWTSTSDAINPDLAWPVYFDDGYVYSDIKTYTDYVRCVRGGP